MGQIDAVGEAVGESPCHHCHHNTKKGGGVRRDGTIQCRLDEKGMIIPKDERGYQPHNLVSPLPADCVCRWQANHARPLMEAARRAREALKAAQTANT